MDPGADALARYSLHTLFKVCVYVRVRPSRSCQRRSRREKMAAESARAVPT